MANYSSDLPRDPTPIIASPTDVAPLTHRGPKPPHERTADEEAGSVDWDRIAATGEFKDLLRAKARFIVPMTIFFTVYYFALPILVGFMPETMKKQVGWTNVAYLFALSQFFMAWGVAYAYTRVAARWDVDAANVIRKYHGK